MTYEEETKRIRKLREDAEARAMYALAVCYQQWLLSVMLEEVSKITDDMVRKSIERWQ
jgi:hypothetical protein